MKPLQSDLQKRMLQVHAWILKVANAMVNPIRKLFDSNTPAFESKLRVVKGRVVGG